MKQFYTILLLIALISATGFRSLLHAQIIIQSGTQPEELVEMITGEGVITNNVTYQGAGIARGTFNNGSTTNLGLNKGIILCTGDVSDIPGPNTQCFITTINNTPGHPLFNTLSSYGLPSEDAAILEFNVKPESDTLSFTYIFGSESYNNWVLPPEDIFACFVTGPNPTGGSYLYKNIAIVPNTDDTYIGVLNINNGFAGCGLVSSGPCENCEFYVDNIDGLSIAYDGFTTALQANLSVIPCQDYHIVIGIADIFTLTIDGAVFIEQTDYQSPVMQITLSPDTSSTVNLIEGCSTADLIFKLPDVKYSPAIVSLDMNGSTADPEIDFEEPLPNELFIEEGQDSISLHIQPVKDGLAEGDEVLQVIIEYSLTCPVYYDTIEIVISDYFDMTTQTPPDTTVCQGEETTLWVNVENGIPPYNFTWEGLPFTNDTITVNPTENSWYYVQVTDQCTDTIVDSIYVEVLPAPEVTLGNDTTICTGDAITLQSPGSYPSYLWSTGDTTASITITQPGTYTLTVSNACGMAQDNITIDHFPYPDPQLGGDLQLCYGETAQLQAAYGFLSYTWQDNSTEDFYTVTQGGLYWVEVQDLNGCTGTDTVFAEVASIVSFPQDTLPLCEGESRTINAGSGFDFYTWSTGQTGTDSITITQQGWYGVEVSYYYGCESTDSLFAETWPEPVAQITGQDYLCQGDTLWLQSPEGKYQIYWNNELTNDNQLPVTQPGTYTLKLVNQCGEDSDSKTIEELDLPTIDLGDDRLLFPGEEITLDAGHYDSITWSNHTHGQYYTIRYADINGKDSIWVNVFDGFCKNTDDIIIEVFDIKVPELITPNGDGANDVFRPFESWNGITRHHIRVFNRWGEKLWESSNFPAGWDARQNGKTIADGTYFWILEVWYGKDEVKKVYKRSLTVLGGS